MLAPELQGAVINFESRQNIPIIGIKVNHEEVKAFFDTGAKISYLKKSLIGLSPVLGKVPDFYPGFGEFETELHEMVVTIVDKPLKFKCGTLPALLETTLLMFGSDGIVGNELFTYFSFVRIDYKNQIMVLK